MKKRERLQLLLLLSLAALATLLLAGGLSGLQLRPGQPFPFWVNLVVALSPGSGLPAGTGWFESVWRILITILLFVVMPLWLILFIISPRARKQMLTKLPAYLIWALLIYALSRAIQRLKPLQVNQNEAALVPASPVAGPGQNLPAPPTFVINPPQWLIIGLSLLVIALLLAAAWFVWQRARHPHSSLKLVVLEAQQALEQLQAGHNMTDTIMRCYVEMNQVLSRQHGIHRHQAMTPREFEQYLAEIGLGDEHIGRLTRLFERVRYGGTNLTGEQEEREAVACLAAIVQAYGRPS